MSYGLNLGWGGPLGDYIGFWRGTSSGIYYKFSQGAHVVTGGSNFGVLGGKDLGARFWGLGSWGFVGGRK